MNDFLKRFTNKKYFKGSRVPIPFLKRMEELSLTDEEFKELIREVDKALDDFDVVVDVE